MSGRNRSLPPSRRSVLTGFALATAAPLVPTLPTKSLGPAIANLALADTTPTAAVEAIETLMSFGGGSRLASALQYDFIVPFLLDDTQALDAANQATSYLAKDSNGAAYVRSKPARQLALLQDMLDGLDHLSRRNLTLKNYARSAIPFLAAHEHRAMNGFVEMAIYANLDTEQLAENVDRLEQAGYSEWSQLRAVIHHKIELAVDLLLNDPGHPDYQTNLKQFLDFAGKEQLYGYKTPELSAAETKAQKALAEAHADNQPTLAPPAADWHVVLAAPRRGERSMRFFIAARENTTLNARQLRRRLNHLVLSTDNAPLREAPFALTPRQGGNGFVVATRHSQLVRTLMQLAQPAP